MVLGADILAEIWDDQSHTTLPSTISPAPKKIGSRTGTLKADQWRALGTIHLVITLVRLWAFADCRKKLMLANFMHLVSSVQLANVRHTSPSVINGYDEHYMQYLRGFLELYKEVPLMPTNHLAAHYPEFMDGFGPSPAWRGWAMERFNHMLQNVPTNAKSGMLGIPNNIQILMISRGARAYDDAPCKLCRK